MVAMEAVGGAATEEGEEGGEGGRWGRRGRRRTLSWNGRREGRRPLTGN